MKISFIAPPRGFEKLQDFHKKVYKEIERLGYQHTTDMAIRSAEEFYKQMNKGESAHQDFHNEMIKSIYSADICVFEISIASLGTGSLIDKALDRNKPVVLLYSKDNIPYFLAGSVDDRIVRCEYTEKNWKKRFQECLEKSRERRDKRFNFFISPKLLDFLEKRSSDLGITKSKYIRNLIIDHMRDS
ncbi:MAG: hypothetical protein ACOCXQ_01625 [Patescibacteria group bacterium]